MELVVHYYYTLVYKALQNLHIWDLWKRAPSVRTIKYWFSVWVWILPPLSSPTLQQDRHFILPTLGPQLWMCSYGSLIRTWIFWGSWNCWYIVETEPKVILTSRGFQSFWYSLSKRVSIRSPSATPFLPNSMVWSLTQFLCLPSIEKNIHNFAVCLISWLLPGDRKSRWPPSLLVCWG